MALSLRTILVCRTDALGDTLLTLPVVSALKANFPTAQITFLASPYTASLIRQQPMIDDVMEYRPDQGLIQDLAPRKFDAALVVFPDPQVAWAVFRSGINYRVGTGRRLWSFLFNHRIAHSRKLATRHEADYNLDLVRQLGVAVELQAPRLTVSQADQDWAARYRALTMKVKPQEPWVIVHPGSRGSAANWSPERYGELVQAIQSQLQIRVLVTGAMTEQAVLLRVAAQCTQPPWLLQEKISLPQFAGLIQNARVLVAGNTGPLHLAAALNTAVVGLYPASGATGPVRWGPLATKKIILTPDPTLDPLAVNQISVAEVVKSVRVFMERVN